MESISFHDHIFEHIECLKNLKKIEQEILLGAEILVETIQSGKRIFVCGNGGSAADAQHFAAELVGRFEKERRPCPALSLTTDTSVLTAIANDYGFDRVFSRQIEALGQKGDTIIGISTSGNSPNIIDAMRKAVSMEIRTIGLLGRDGGTIASEVGCPVVIPHSRTARIQEAHSFILHFWAYFLDTKVVALPS